MTIKPLSDEQIGLAVRTIRKAKKIKVGHLAKMCDVRASYMCRIESGILTLKISLARKICNALQVSLDDLADTAETLEATVNQLNTLTEAFKQTTAYSTDNKASVTRT
jgi:transcriptional regulator with XRE-family HTH domain